MTKKKLMEAMTSNPEDLEIEEAWVIESGGTWNKFHDVEKLIPHLMDRSIYGYSVSNVEFGEKMSDDYDMDTLYKDIDLSNYGMDGE